MAINIVGGQANMVSYVCATPTVLSGSVINSSNTTIIYAFDGGGNILSYQPGRGINAFSQLDHGLGDARGFWIVATQSYFLPCVVPTLFSSSSSSSSLSSTSHSSSSRSSSSSSSAGLVFPNRNNVVPLPAPSGTIVNVSTVSQLQNAVANIQSGQTIVIAAGTYNLTSQLALGYVNAVSNVQIRGATGNANDVVLVGDTTLDPVNYTGSAIWGANSGITEGQYGINFGIQFTKVTNITIGDLTFRNFLYSTVQIDDNGPSSGILLHNLNLLDCGEQIIKVNCSTAGDMNGGIIEYCTIGYSTTNGAPNGYTNGIDLIGPISSWTMRYNLFQNILTNNTVNGSWGTGQAGPALLAWTGASNCTTWANTFLNCQREISYGLQSSSSADCTGGLIANNMLWRPSGLANGDVGITTVNCPNTLMAYNTIVQNGTYSGIGSAIEYRFAGTTGVNIDYNVTDGGTIVQRDSASATLTGNNEAATSTWFVNPSVGNLNLTSQASPLFDAGHYLSQVPTDYNGKARQLLTDVGAVQFSAGSSSSSSSSSA